MMGENQFSGVQVYDVIQGDDFNYIFATNEGIYLYDFYTYTRLECAGSSSNEVFNFVSDKFGTVYCNNLNGQVLQIRKKECKVIYQLTPDETRADLNLAIGNDNSLLIGGNKVVVLDEQGKVLQKYPVHGYLNLPYKTPDGKILYHLSRGNSIVSYDQGKFSFQPLRIEHDMSVNNLVLTFVRLKNESYALDQNSKRFFGFDEKNFSLTTSEKQQVLDRGIRLRTYNPNANVLWVAGTRNGVSFIDGALPDQTSIFDQFYISDVYVDQEGNTLLSTFDKGIIVIPNLQVPGVIETFNDDPATSVRSATGLGVLLGTSKGKLLQYNRTTISTLSDNGNRPVEGIYTTSNFPYVIYDNGQVNFRNKSNGKTINPIVGSLKDAVFPTDTFAYLGTNLGVLECRVSGGDLVYQRIKNGRVHSLAITETSGELYAATAEGLLRLTKDGFHPVLNKGQKLFSQVIGSFADTIYVAEEKNVLYKVHNGEVRSKLSLLINDQATYPGKVRVTKKGVFVKSGSQLHLFSLTGNYKGNLGLQNGFARQHTVDFDVDDEWLYVTHTGGFQQISLKQNQAVIAPPPAQLSGILVNDALQSATVTRFDSDQRKIKFILVSPSLRQEGSVNFWYKLTGGDERWSATGPGIHEVTYNALAPGSYTFTAKAEHQGIYSKETSYTFIIASPIYTRWWFILSSVTLFLGAVTLVYRRQVAAQQKKARIQSELNTLKLTAIQSQMNPHFIFNSLNAIQDLVLKGDVENTYTLITKFSDLIRRTLDYSEKDFIDFEQEIKLIELYLALEKIRFKSTLTCTLNASEVEDIMVPPMLIQPFIENALLHGLMHKDGAKKLDIHFSLKEQLICTIEDNGIGRENAAKIKLRQGSLHESFSGKAIKKRFEILSQHYQSQLGFHYEDLYDNGFASGTRVTVTIPVKHKY